MSQENVEHAERGVVAINETYRTGDMGPWRRDVEEVFDPDVVLEAEGHAFTEGEWRGREGAAGFVANQMEVLEGMWLRADESASTSMRTASCCDHIRWADTAHRRPGRVASSSRFSFWFSFDIPYSDSPAALRAISRAL